jgi:predicted ATP-dependent serine protease
MARFAASLSTGRLGSWDWVDRVRESVHPWNVVPILLAVVTLTAGGFWLGSVVGGGGHAGAAVATRTIRVEGQVITVGGVRYVSTPASIVRVHGREVRLAAQTVALPGDAKATPGRTIRVSTTVNGTSVATVVQTVTVPVTVTAPASTVTGPTTTVANTITVPVLSTVTLTLP